LSCIIYVLQRCDPSAGYDGIKADVWSAGVLLYVALVARFPFDSEDDGEPGDYDVLAYNVWKKQVIRAFG